MATAHHGDAMPDRGLDSAWALWGGIAFSAGFTWLIWAVSDRLAAVDHLPDQGASWYFWVLPEPTIGTRAVAWGLYAAHQCASWATIWYAQVRVRHYTAGLHRVNVVALAINAAFIAVHVVQTHLTYDGLAQDVSIWSALGSVAILLIWVLLMENDRRGMAFGRRLPLPREIVRFARKHHGYYFSWAMIYTFWYHPTEATSGHLVGFFYMFMLLLQGSLFLTRAHVNRWWTVSLEALVLVHGALVAVTQGAGLWAMFAFGFATMFIVTQMHGLGLSRGARLGWGLAYLGALALTYGGGELVRINEVVRIPVIDYVGVGLLAGVLWLVMRLVHRSGTSSTVAPTAIAE
jgi:hypothetical protein